MPPRFVMAALAALALASGCFYDEVVNEAPVAGIRSLSGPQVYVGDVLRFDATKSVDDTPGGLRAEWQAQTCNDEQVPRCTQVASASGGLATVFTVPVESHDTIEVQLRVTDELGATRRQPDLLTVPVQNRAPSVELQRNGFQEEGHFILYRPIQIVLTNPLGTESFDPDGDPVRFTWQLFAPPMSDASERTFEPVEDQGYLLVPDVAGSWTVEVTVADEYGGFDSYRIELLVGSDAPPCIRGLEPKTHDSGFFVVASEDGAKRFSVLSVADALDPYPAPAEADPALGEAEFQWFLRAPNEEAFSLVPGASEPSFSVDPLAFEPGDQLEVRVHVTDRVVGPERVLGCAPSARRCELVAGSECYQRQTWGVEIR